MKKNKWYVLGMMAMALTFGMAVVGCNDDDEGTNYGDEKISFTWGDYTLGMYQNGNQTVYVPTTGDHHYEIRNSQGNVISSGDITVGIAVSLGDIIMAKKDGYTFSPSSGKPSFYGFLSPNATTFQIGTITLDNGTQLLGLLLSNNEDNGNEVPVYTSYTAAVEAGYLFHNGQISSNLDSNEFSDALDALMKTIDYTRIKINSYLPIKSNFSFDIDVVVNGLNLQGNDYFKWDIQYNDHRILAYYYAQGGGGCMYGWSVVNEVMLLPAINGGDYSSGTIKHVDFEYGVSDNDIMYDIIYDNSLVYDEFSINGKAPVDNLGLLQTTRIVDAIKTSRGITIHAGDYLTWKITYNDSKWSIRCFIMAINVNGYIEPWLLGGGATREL
jgi:hypothetical protein